MSRRQILAYQAAPTQLGLPNRQQQVFIGSQSIHIHHHYHSQGTTPNVRSGQQMVSRTHSTRNHVHTRIRKTDNKTLYRCSECNELGNKDRYVCQHCPYVQHLNCKDYKQRATHPLFKSSTFKLRQQHSDGNRACNACGLNIGQLFYHCERTNRVMHPFCLNNLTCSITTGGRNYNLCRTVTSKACSRCLSRRKDHKDNCWWYSSERQDSQYHVSCMMEIFLTPK
ncbi:hypothetical protein CTI12_AA509920 [Artemisia annua]|uniref:DC1 domain-containing protein n=1 Tax=Artemisia annua TaxID=35608 RepID=A0A2U1L3V2_ARTAN|nr:hypothetical protein CTI12_AA509920 [Artemisia annua]